MKGRRIVSLAAVFGLLLSQAVFAEGTPSDEAGLSTELPAVTVTAQAGYVEYREDHASVSPAGSAVPLSGGVEQLCEAGAVLTYPIEIPADGLYELALEYISQASTDAVFSLHIDNEAPFSEATRLQFPGGWVDKGEPLTDELGNQSVPEQVLDTESVYRTAQNYSGVSAEPYRFALTAGLHTVTLTMTQGKILLKDAQLTVPEQALSYQEWIAGQKLTFSGERIVLEGEAADKKSNRALIPLSNNSSAAVYPSEPSKSILNYIGGSNWKKPGDTLTWKFSVETAGYYSLGIQYRQGAVIGGVSYRHLKIDGKTPFAEAAQMKFTYDNNWTYWPFRDENGQDYWIYLDAGEHTLSLSVTPGPVGDIYAKMQEVVAALGDLYVDVTMVVGETVDIYRSYNLFEQVPNFQERLQQNIQALDELATQMEQLQESGSGSQVSVLDNMANILKQMHDRPYTAHRYVSTFFSNYTNLSATVAGLTDMPLDVDRIYLLGGEEARPDKEPSFFENLWFSVRRVVATFSADYSVTSSAEEGDKDSLTIWVNWGRDQAQVLDSLIRNDFVPRYGIDVNIRVTNATLIQGILSGNGPDCMLQMARSEPVNLAMRGALRELSSFADFEEVTKQFVDGAWVPYRYREGIYALPDTQNFYVQYIRTDILEELGIKAPETWEEYLQATTVLQRANLQASLPYSPSVDGGLYTTLLLQEGLELFRDDLSASLLTNTEQIQVFERWTSWYTEYKIPTTMDFYNRFRIGSAPLGIASYTLYNQIKIAAPELEGRWEITPIPGVRQEDGSINRYVAGSGTGCGITKLAANPDNAWTFLKWWTSANTQVQYSNRLESLLGSVGRVAVANVDALDDLGWDKESLAVLREQQAFVKEMREVPGSYYVSRGIDQGFWNVVEQNANPTDTMLKWGAIVDTEIRRKTNEYKNK
ncbi:MAG: extracellular solute-binding protein [Clostridia bacterium]|nr:extracellular solute-binding protein [Clostridia bacterium]